MPGPFGRQQYVMLPEEELRAQQEAMAQAPQAQPQPSYTNDFLGFLQGLTKQQEAAQSQHAAQMAQEMEGAKEQDAAQRFANMMMAGGATMLGNPNVSSQHMQLAQQNNAQNALQLKDKNFQEWLGKRFDIGKQAGEYNQARYHDLIAGNQAASMDMRGRELAQQADERKLDRELRGTQFEAQIKNQQSNNAQGWASIDEVRRHNRAMEGIASGRQPAGSAKAAGAASLLPEGWEFRDPAAASFVTPAQVGETQKILETKNKIKTLTEQLKAIASNEGGRAFLGENRALSNSLYESLLLTLKEAKNLGVLQKIDVEHLSEFVPNPLEYKPGVKNPSTYGTDMKKLEAFIDSIEPDFEASMQARGLQRKQPAGGTVSIKQKSTGRIVQADPSDVEAFMKKYGNEFEVVK